MSISEMGVDGVLQFAPDYLQACIDDEIDRERVSCLDTDGNTIEVGDTSIRATDVTLSLESTGFAQEGNGTALEIELTAKNGTLEAGRDARSLQETMSTTVTVPLSVREDPTEDRVVQLLVETELPDVGDVGVDVLDYADLDAHGVSFAPDGDVGAVKLLPDGTVAIGLLNDAPGSSLSEFSQDYTDAELSRDDTWGLVLDRSMVKRYVESIEIGDEQGDDTEPSEGDLKDVNLTLNGIYDQNLSLEAEGKSWVELQEFPGLRGWVPFTADIDAELTVNNPGADGGSQIIADYWIAEAWAPAIGDDATDRLEEENQRHGETVFLSPAHLGDPMDPVGRLYATVAAVERGEVVITGKHKRVGPASPQVSVEPSELVLAPGCGDLDEETVVVSHPKRNDGASRQVDLGVCDITITGRGTEPTKFSWDGPEPSFTIKPGRSQQVTVSTSADPGEAYEATLEIETGAGRENVELKTADESGEVEVPKEKDVIGEQINRTSCLPALNMAQATIEVINRSTSQVAICSTPRIRNETGGSWGVSGLAKNDVVDSGSTELVTVTFEVSDAQLGEEETAELVIDTSGGKHVVHLTGRVEENEDLPGGWYGGVSGSEICAEDFDVAIMGELIQQALKIIHGDGPIIDIPPVEPRPDPPMPLHVLELQLFSVPLGTRIGMLQSTGDQVAMFEPVAANPNLLLPLSGAEDVQAEVEVPETDQPMSLKGRVWQFTGEVTDVPHDCIGAVASDGTTLAATTPGGIATFAAGPEGTIEPLTRRDLNFEPIGIAAVGDLFLVSGQEQYEAFYTIGEKLRSAGGCGVRIETLVDGTLNGQQPLAFAVRDEELVIFSVAEPSEPRTLAEMELNLEGVTGGFAARRQLALFGTDGIAVYDIADPTSPEAVGMVELPEIEAILTFGHRVFAITKDRTFAILEQADGDLRQTGAVHLPPAVLETLPSGRLAFLNGHAITPSPTGDGLAVFGADRLTWEDSHRERQRKHGLNKRDITDGLIEALASIGDSVDDVIERLLGVDLIEDDSDRLKRR